MELGGGQQAVKDKTSRDALFAVLAYDESPSQSLCDLLAEVGAQLICGRL